MAKAKQAIEWLAAFHAAFYNHPILRSTEDDEHSIWSSGGYWHLPTRMNELENMSTHGSKIMLKMSALAIDERMNRVNLDGNSSFTLVHGDYKEANILFGSSNCAVVDFQYCGKGYGAKDLVMYVVSSMSTRVFEEMGGEDGVLGFYCGRLRDNLDHTKKHSSTGTAGGANANLDVLKMQYELALVDYVRFMAGWGMWGSQCNYAEGRALEILDEVATEWVCAGQDKSKFDFTSADWMEAINGKYPEEMF